MRDRIFSSVDLPAPLRPMMPSTSPCFTSKLTSFSAQKRWSAATLPRNWPTRLSGARITSVSVSTKVCVCGAADAPSTYSLPRPSATTGCMALDDVGETPLHPQEVLHADDQHHQRRCAGDQDALRVIRHVEDGVAQQV